MTRKDAQTLNNEELLSYQVSFVRKMVNELNAYDNFFFEIQNEPWSDHTIPVYNIVNKDELRAIGTEHSSLLLETGEGNFLVQTLNTTTGAFSKPILILSREGVLEIDIEIPEGELALKITSE